MRLLIDENIRRDVREFITGAGHDIMIVPSALEDEKIALLAKETQRTILTHDLHFADILTYPPAEYPGIIRIRIHPPSAPLIINALKGLFARLSQSDIKGRLIILEPVGFRIK